MYALEALVALMILITSFHFAALVIQVGTELDGEGS
jgi:hypothetical protein